MTIQFATRVTRNRKYRQLTSDRKRPDREISVEQTIFALAEHEISKLQQHLRKLEGQLRVSRTEKRVLRVEQRAALAEQKVQLLARLGQLLVTPLSETLAVQRIDGPHRNGRSVIQLEPAPKQITSDGRATHKSDNSWSHRVYDALPKYLQVVVDLVATQLRRLTPLSMAVLLILVSTGAFVWAKHSKSSLESMYDTVLTHKSELEKELVALRPLKDTAEKLRNEIGGEKKKFALQENEIKSIKTDLVQAKDELRLAKEEHAKSIDQLRADHQEQLRLFQMNADEGIKKRNEDLENDNERLRAQLEDALEENEKKAEDLGRLASIEDSYQKQEKHLESLRSERDAFLRDLQDTRKALDYIKQQNRYMHSFIVGIDAELKSGLVYTSQQNLRYFQDKFRSKFNDLFDANAGYYRQELNLTRY